MPAGGRDLLQDHRLRGCQLPPGFAGGQRDIFEHLCDFYNGYDPTIGVQMSLSSRYVEHGPEEDLFGIVPRVTTWTLSGRMRRDTPLPV